MSCFRERSTGRVSSCQGICGLGKGAGSQLLAWGEEGCSGAPRMGTWKAQPRAFIITYLPGTCREVLVSS